MDQKVDIRVSINNITCSVKFMFSVVEPNSHIYRGRKLNETFFVFETKMKVKTKKKMYVEHFYVEKVFLLLS